MAVGAEIGADTINTLRGMDRYRDAHAARAGEVRSTCHALRILVTSAFLGLEYPLSLLVNLMADTLQILTKIIAEKLDVSPDKITAESTMEDIGLDSLDIFDVIFRAEDAFNIKVSNYQVDLKTLQDVVNLIDELIKEQHPA